MNKIIQGATNHSKICFSKSIN